ncbi:hypothetical protein HY627_02460 [Candidatus Uhrbacteria bacterium]|nr:hypothetical protein [Candidatus Uhrbacteria bacterium]
MKITSVNELVEAIKERAQGTRYFIIAISGFGGSGKSTLSKHLAQLLGDTTIVSVDDFSLHRQAARAQAWESLDWDRLALQVLKPLKNGDSEITYDIYDWSSDSLQEKRTISLTRYVIIEGIGCIRDELMHYFDLTVWLDVPLTIASERGKKRDREIFNIDHDKQWDEIWTPNDKDYFERCHPVQKADFILSLGE